MRAMPLSSTLEQNHLLAAIPTDTRSRLLPHLELVELPRGKVLHEMGEKVGYAYFPTDSIVAILAILENGACTEVSLVGNDGVVGISSFMGGEAVTTQAIVHGAGRAYRIKAMWLNREFARHGDMLVLLLRYTQALISQTAQKAMCNRHHSIDQQLCRMLLQSLDCLSGDELVVTHETIANMLGVRRESVTEAAGRLKATGLIECHRGKVRVLDRAGLEKHCCECYGAITAGRAWVTSNKRTPGPRVFSPDQDTPHEHNPGQNRLLGGLSAPVQARLFPYLERVSMALGEPVYEDGDSLRHVYFPVDCIVSLLPETASGESTEIAVVGNEGLVGTSLFMGGDKARGRALVQSAGSAYRLPAQRLGEEFDRHGELFHLLLRYTQSLLTQMAQTAVCNRHHSVGQQLCRWLLVSLDRLDGPELITTQELIANLLGVRRVGVTEAAGRLQKLGIIQHKRGRIKVIDRPGLEQLSCECYRVAKEETDRLLPPPPLPLSHPGHP